jgi:hypothetical protein
MRDKIVHPNLSVLTGHRAKVTGDHPLAFAFRQRITQKPPQGSPPMNVKQLIARLFGRELATASTCHSSCNDGGDCRCFTIL